jgi:oligopeptide/dipeptide ABC transporter ATP-binding protein
MKEHDRLVDRKVSYFQRIPMAIIKPFRLIIESARSNPVSTASPFVLLVIYFAVVKLGMNNQFESISWYLLPLLLVGYYFSRLVNSNTGDKEYLDALFETLPFLPMAFAFSLILYLVFWMPTQAVLVILVVLAVISLPWIIISDYLQLDEAHREQVIEILHEVKIPNPEAVVKMYPHELSGGMRQRVMIAMMMACEPKLLIADEPTTALDVTIQAQILKLMRDLREEKGTSILLITHDLGVIAEMCDTVSVMYAGRVVEDASVEEIFANPTHAYTRGLLASSPKLDSDRKSVLPTIPGQVAQPSDFVPGCRFCQRMNRQGDTIEIRPEMKEISPGHWIENCPICANSKIDWRVEANV